LHKPRQRGHRGHAPKQEQYRPDGPHAERLNPETGKLGEALAKIKELTDGLGALGHRGRRHPGVNDAGHPGHPPGGHVGYVGISHDVSLDGLELFFSGIHLHGGPAPVRRFLPELNSTTAVPG
jgi:hypothetical protein